jgi:hypothetical protein
MAFSFLVCAMFLLTILYFTALVTGEFALWLVGRVTNQERKPQSVLAPSL